MAGAPTNSGNFQDMATAHDTFDFTTTKAYNFIQEVTRERDALEKTHKGESAKIFGDKLGFWLADMQRVHDSLDRMTNALGVTKNNQIQTQEINNQDANTFDPQLNY